MLYSTFPFDRHGASTAAISRTSLARMWRSSARGCTVIPGAPASRHVTTAAVTLGTRPPREFRSVATLLTLTERLIIANRVQYSPWRTWGAMELHVPHG